VVYRWGKFFAHSGKLGLDCGYDGLLCADGGRCLLLWRWFRGRHLLGLGRGADLDDGDGRGLADLIRGYFWR
jgi:hypothetical protein